jgi:hypothetical protein
MTSVDGATTQSQYVAGDANANFQKDGIVVQTYAYSGTVDVRNAGQVDLEQLYEGVDDSQIQYGGSAVVSELALGVFGKGGDSVNQPFFDLYGSLSSDWGQGVSQESNWAPWSYVAWGVTPYSDSDIVSDTGLKPVTASASSAPAPAPGMVIGGVAVKVGGPGDLDMDVGGETWVYNGAAGTVSLGSVDSTTGQIVAGVGTPVAGLDAAVAFAQQSAAATQSTETTVYADGMTVNLTLQLQAGGGYSLLSETASDLSGDTYSLTGADATAKNAAGYSISSTDSGSLGVLTSVLRNPDGSIAESNTNNGWTYNDWATDVFGNIFTANVSNTVSGDGGTATMNDTDVLGDQINTVAVAGGNGASPSVTSSWTESDGTVVSVAFDTADQITTATMKYTDGTSTLLQSDALGNYGGTNYDASGNAVGDEWGNPDGSYGWDTYGADGSYSNNTVNADGSTASDAYVASTGETSGSNHAADSSVANTWDVLPLANGETESKTSNTDAGGTTVSYDTLSQSDGSFTQTWTSTDGTSGTNTLDASTGETTGSTVQADGVSSVAWDITTLADGDQETKQHVTYADSSWASVDTISYTDGASADTWTKSDGSNGSDAYGAQAGAGDTFAWQRGDTYAELQTYDGNDRLAIGTGVANDQLWFQQNGSNLDISILGTNDDITVVGWYNGSSSQLASISLADGEILSGSDVQKLVDAMGGFAPPSASQTQYTTQESNVIAPVIAANWH